MRAWIRALVLLCIGMVLLVLALPSAISQEGIVRAKIGILVKSDGQAARPARSADRIRAMDLLRIYVHPEANAFVYVVHTDRKAVTLLSMVKHRIHSSTTVLPSIQDFYQVDGVSSVEAFTIVCSPSELKELSALNTARMPYERWTALEADLLKRGAIDLAQRSEKPFAIAGNVRGVKDTTQDPFVKDLKIFSGRTVLVKRYEFSVTK